MSDSFDVTHCTAAVRPAALRLLHDGLPEEQQSALVHALNSTRPDCEEDFAGLLVAIDPAEELLGAIWVQLAPGNTAVVWPPASDSLAAVALLQAAAEFIDQQQLALAQLLISPDSSMKSSLLSSAGFRVLAHLAYLTIDKQFFPGTKPQSDLQFLPRANDDPGRLGGLLMRTYEGTLDCPELNGVRRPEEIIEGYAEQGAFSPQLWFIASYKQQDIGALILTEHAEGENWELVYMGVTPEGRGQGFGWQIVQFALWQAGLAGAQRLVLAVDEENSHALQVYRRAGFIVWDRRTVFARLRRSKSNGIPEQPL